MFHISFNFFARRSRANQASAKAEGQRIRYTLTESVTERIRQEERAKAVKEARKEERAKIREELAKIREERAKAKEEHRKMVATLRQTVVELVSQRFPEQARLARAQARTLEEPERFQQLILRLSLARDAEETENILFALTEEEEEAGEPKAAS